MLKDTIIRYNNSSKTREDRNEYMKDVLASLIEFRNTMGGILTQSAAEGIVIKDNRIMLKMGKEYGDFCMTLDKDDYCAVPNAILTLGNYEPEELGMVKKILDLIDNDKMTVFDIGANLGWYTLNIKKRYKNSTIYSFEPSPVTYERLCTNLKINNLSPDNAINLGLYKENGRLEFYYNREDGGSSSLANLRGTEAVSKIDVDMVKLDDWVKDRNIDRLDFIKCDVEGSELFVYMGGHDTIKKYKPVVFSEMLRKWAAKFGYHPNDIIDWYDEMGYDCFVINGNMGLSKFGRVDDETIETNYFFLHREKHSELINKLMM